MGCFCFIYFWTLGCQVSIEQNIFTTYPHAEADVKIAGLKIEKLNNTKDEEIKKLLEQIKAQKEQNGKMKAACEAAEKGTAALKNALNACQETLQDVV